MQDLCIGGTKIEVKSEAKYLGVILDQQLTFESHITHKINECKATAVILNNNVRAAHGPIPELARGVFRSVVISKLTYGCHTFQHKLTNDLREKLGSLNRRGATAICSVFPGTGTGGLEVLLGLKPLHLIMWETAMNTAARMDIVPGWDGRRKGSLELVGHIHCLNKELKNYTEGRATDNTVTRNMPKLNVKTRRSWKGDESDIMVFTDGSKSVRGTGAGIVIKQKMSPDLDYKGKLSNEHTALEAEYNALEMGARKLTDMRIKGKLITVISDSKNALNGMNSEKIKNDQQRACIEAWQVVAHQNEVKFRWTKGHSGVQGNEKADKLAKEGASQPNVGTKQKRLCPKLLSLRLKESSKEKWQAEWMSKPSYCRQPKQWMSRPDGKKIGQLLKLKKPVLSRAIQLVTGFNNMNNHTARKINFLDKARAKCRLCKTGVEDAWHLATQCNVIRGQVKDIFDPRESWTVPQLVKFLEVEEIALLLAERTVM